MGDAIYLRSAVRRWQAELRRSAGDRVVVAFPYLTSDTAELVLRCTAPSLCEVYTVFAAENFASGASSLGTLETLIDEGFAVYDLPGLHAKIVLVAGVCATIGSQNLTRGGTKNKEATVVLTQRKEVESVERGLNDWIFLRRAITREMIAELRAELPVLTRSFRSLQRKSEAVDRKIRLAIQHREEERLRLLRRRLAEMPNAKEMMIGRVARVEQQGYVWSGSTTYSLLAKPGDDFTRWSVDGRLIRLERMNRYLCLLPDTGRFGWARVGKTRITFVGDGIERIDMSFGDFACKVEFSALWETPEKDFTGNVVVGLRVGGFDGVDVSCWFGVDTLTIVRIKAARRSRTTRRLKQWIEENDAGFRQQIIARLSRPFRYEHNRFGNEATTFFGPVGSRFHLRVALAGEHPLLYCRAV